MFKTALIKTKNAILKVESQQTGNVNMFQECFGILNKCYLFAGYFVQSLQTYKMREDVENINLFNILLLWLCQIKYHSYERLLTLIT